MKRLFWVLVGIAGLASCASTVPMAVTKIPPNKTQEQMQLDNLECHNMSMTNGPWLYGIGTAIYKKKAAEKFQECMKAKGYDTVRATDTGTNNGATTPTAAVPVLSKPVPTVSTPASTLPPSQAPAAQVPVLGSPADRLKKLDDVYKAGLMTKEEYDRKRQEIMATL